MDAYQEDVITLTELKPRKEKLQVDIKQIAQQLSQLSDQQHKLIHWQEVIDNATAFTALLGTNLSLLSFQDRHLVAQALIEKVVVSGQDVDIFYVLPFHDPPTDLTGKSDTADFAISNADHFCRLRLEHRVLRG